MAEELLGPAFEIHGGGLDLVFPHHENELAQSRALGHDFARIWAHNGLLQFTGDKMSKSLGNIATIREVLDAWGREALLVFFLGGHWRKPIDFSDETMAQAAAQVEGFRDVFARRTGRRRRAAWERVRRRRSTTTSTRPRRSRSCTSGGRPLTLLRRGLALFGLGSLAEHDEAPPTEIVELAERAQRRARRTRLRRGRPAPRRDRGGGLGDARRRRAPASARPRR